MTNNHTLLSVVLIGTTLLSGIARGQQGDASTVDLFTAGQGGYAHYRIPGLVVTKAGTILAYCEARVSLVGDWGETDILIRRSTDGGRTWDESRKLARAPRDAARNPVVLEQNIGPRDAITMNNPVAIADPVSGAVHVLYCVDYGRCFYARSDDDGKTFSEPREITAAAFDPFKKTYPWRVIATGPGHGIRLSKSGRLVVPVWLSHGTGKSGHRPSCVATIFSDDAGKTWQAGDIVVDHPRLANPSETAAAELSDGRVMLNVRHEGDPKGPSGAGGTTWRAVFVGPDGATGWGEHRLDKGLPDPVCMAGLLSVGGEGGKRSLLFVNPANDTDKRRRNLTVRQSDDDGQAWRVARVIDTGTAGYSDLAATADGKTVYCLYERGSATPPGEKPRGVGALTLVRFDLPAPGAATAGANDAAKDPK